MTEFDYDCYRKKGIARSAARKKGGSKSKKCSLPSDNMTEREWKERNGAVMSYQINKPMLWSEFSVLPNDLKEEYLNSLIERYAASASAISKMFGISTATLFRIIKKEALDVKFLKGRHSTGPKAAAFEEFLTGEKGGVPAQDEVDGSELIELVSDGGERESNEGNGVTSAQEMRAVPKTRLDCFTMSFSGEVNVEMIANSLRYILSGGGNAKIQVTCELY